jgi:cyclophilin family peptidyl-prolyl cis-trans isomerase
MKIIIYLICVVLLSACGATKNTSTTPNRVKPGKTAEPITGRIVQLHTDLGVMTIALSDSTPKHRDNFIKLIKEGFYDSLMFHRVINQFMIQGGDPDSKRAIPNQTLGMGGLDYRVPAEFTPSLFHKKGALAAARDGNPEKASSSCQFYIVQGKSFNDTELNSISMQRTSAMPDSIRQIYKTVGGTPHLDGNYTVFGQVIQGYEVIDKIATLITDGSNRPKRDVRMRFIIIR